MSALEALRARLPESARDIKLNLQAVLQPGQLSAPRRWGVAVAAAANARHPELLAAMVAAAHAEVGAAVVDDALAAASLMAMNNVYYRFRHVIGNDVYSTKPARLRMNRLVKPVGDKLDFELFCLAVSAMNNCQACMTAHEKTVVDGGVTTDDIHDAVRIAAVVQAAAVSLDIAAVDRSAALSAA